MADNPSKSGEHPADLPLVSSIPAQPPPIAYAPPGLMRPAAGPSPLSAQHLAELAAAKVRQKKVLRATSVATMDAWIMAFLGGISLVMGLLDLPLLTGTLIGAAVCVAACNSFRGLKMLKRLDPRGPVVLGINQLYLATAISVYAGWNIYSAMANPKSITQSLIGTVDPELLGMLNLKPEDVAKYVAIFYVLIILATWIAQGLTAFYYFSRRQHLDAYITSTPQWIHDLQRAQQGK